MDEETRRIVRARAGDTCEYCGLRQEQSPVASLHVEHVIPKKHQGSDDTDNLALACVDCNLYKGTNVAGFDPQTGRLTQLFNPRQQEWGAHFERRGALILGRTAVGRTTVAVLNMNSAEQLELRLESMR
jgi:hypothetical protein